MPSTERHESPSAEDQPQLVPSARDVVAGSFSLRYHTAGTGEPVILVHGAGNGTTALSTFSGSLGVLSERFHVLAPDMPGWGESVAVEFSAADQLAALVGFLDAVGVEQATVVGHSLGGARALDLAAAYPERVSSLILIAAPAPGADLFASPPTEGGRAVFQAYLEPTPENITAALTAICYDPALVTPELVARLSESASAHPEHAANFLTGMARSGGALFAAENPAAAVARIAAPTLVVHGRNDRVVQYESALRLVSTIADSRLLLLNRCGHWPHVEHAREVNSAIVSFSST
jgi:2-hydroxy-6-oxonona-2,4-dienedioate hydrolase